MVTDLLVWTTEENAKWGIRLLEDSGALSYGTFTLASGKVSSYYLDSKKLTLDPRGAHFVAEQMVKKLDSLGITFVGGTAHSAVPIVSQVAFCSDLRDGEPIYAFYHRKEAKAHGNEAKVDGHLPSEEAEVAILEDIVTTGGSVLEAIRYAEDSGCRVTHALTLIDRDEGGREAVESAGYKFWALFTVVQSGDRVTFAYNGS